MIGDRAERWPRTDWLEAVYSSDLRPLERLTAAVYADHARDRDRAWVTLDRLIERSGMSRDAANRARRGLIDKRWLVAIGTPSRRKAMEYRLVVPVASSTGDRPLSSTPGGPLSSTGDGPLSSTPPDASSPPDVPEQSARRTQPQVLPQNTIQCARVPDGGHQPPLLATVDGSSQQRPPAQAEARQAFAAALDAKRRRPA